MPLLGNVTKFCFYMKVSSSRKCPRFWPFPPTFPRFLSWEGHNDFCTLSTPLPSHIKKGTFTMWRRKASSQSCSLSIAPNSKKKENSTGLHYSFPNKESSHPWIEWASSPLHLHPHEEVLLWQHNPCSSSSHLGALSGKRQLIPWKI